MNLSGAFLPKFEGAESKKPMSPVMKKFSEEEECRTTRSRSSPQLTRHNSQGSMLQPKRLQECALMEKVSKFTKEEVMDLKQQLKEQETQVAKLAEMLEASKTETEKLKQQLRENNIKLRIYEGNDLSSLSTPKLTEVKQKLKHTLKKIREEEV